MCSINSRSSCTTRSLLVCPSWTSDSCTTWSVFTSVHGLQAWFVRDNPVCVDEGQQRQRHKDIQIPGRCDGFHCELVKRLQQHWSLVVSYPASLIFSSHFPLQRLPPQAAAQCTCLYSKGVHCPKDCSLSAEYH